MLPRLYRSCRPSENSHRLNCYISPDFPGRGPVCSPGVAPTHGRVEVDYREARPSGLQYSRGTKPLSPSPKPSLPPSRSMPTRLLLPVEAPHRSRHCAITRTGKSPRGIRRQRRTSHLLTMSRNSPKLTLCKSTRKQSKYPEIVPHSRPHHMMHLHGTPQPQRHVP